MFKKIVIKRLALLMISAACMLPQLSSAQDQREVILIAEIAIEHIGQAQQQAQAQIEADHQARLEEQSQLQAAYQSYLGGARRVAQQLIEQRRRGVTQEQVDTLRRQARIVIEEVTDETKQRVTTELDPIFEQLEQGISITPQDLLAADPRLLELRRRIAGQHDLDWVDEVAIMYALCPDNAQAEVIAANVHFREQLSADEADAIDECNRRRLILGLQPLAIDFQLVLAARDHSNDMVTRGFFDHDSPVEGKATPWDRARNFNTSANGENIASGQSDGLDVTRAWWHSPGHLRNLMGRGFTRIGVGQVNQTYTQMFGN